MPAKCSESAASAGLERHTVRPQDKKTNSKNALELRITYQRVADLQNNPHNSRTHIKRQIRQIADSIQAFGFTNPVLIDNHNTIIAGPGRVAGAKRG